MTNKEAFEQWAVLQPLLLRRIVSDERYESMETEWAWRAWATRAQLGTDGAKPPSGLGAGTPPLSARTILHLWDTHVGDPTMKKPLLACDKVAFARAVLYAATPPAPQVGQQVVRMLTDDEVLNAYAEVPWPDDKPAPLWIERIVAVLRKFCKVNGLTIADDTDSPDDLRLWSARWLFEHHWITYDDLQRVKAALVQEVPRG